MRSALLGSLLLLVLTPACTITTAGPCRCMPAAHQHRVRAELPRRERSVHRHIAGQPQAAALPTTRQPTPARPSVVAKPRLERVAKPEPRSGTLRGPTRAKRVRVARGELERVGVDSAPARPDGPQPEARPVTRPEPLPTDKPTSPVTLLPLRRPPERHPKPELPPKHLEPVRAQER
jgi:hypothetical protein